MLVVGGVVVAGPVMIYDVELYYKLIAVTIRKTTFPKLFLNF